MNPADELRKQAIISPGDPGDVSPYRAPQGYWDAMAKADEAWEASPGAQAAIAKMAKGRTTLLRAEGGPFDGMDLNVPPGGSEAILPAAYGDGDMKGKVLYRRVGDRMIYVGPTEQIPDDEDDDG